MRIKPWKKLQEKLPPLSRYELEELKTSIRDHGVLQEILVLPDGRIIDGHHRWKLSGGDVPWQVLRVDEEVGFALGLALNIGRRQITAEQFKDIRGLLSERRNKFVKVALELRKQGKTQSEVGKILGVPRKTISNWENISNGHMAKANIPDLRTLVPRKERPEIYERAKKGNRRRKLRRIIKSAGQGFLKLSNEKGKKRNKKCPSYPKGNST